jgi:hypothetical protein
MTVRLQIALGAESELRSSIAKVDPADQPHVLARHIYELTRRALEGRTDPDARIHLLNTLVDVLEDPESAVAAPTRQLHRLAAPSGPGTADIEPIRTKTPLSDAALLTNSAGEPNLAAELCAEIDTSDEVDLLCAFVKWHGLRLLENELGRLRRRRAPLRVITTTYMGATERAALDRLARELGAEDSHKLDSALPDSLDDIQAELNQTREEVAADTANLIAAAVLETGGNDSFNPELLSRLIDEINKEEAQRQSGASRAR